MTLDDDVGAAVEGLRRLRGPGPRAAIKQLVRAGFAAPVERRPFVQRTGALGLRLDVSNVAQALELLGGPEAR